MPMPLYKKTNYSIWLIDIIYIPGKSFAYGVGEIPLTKDAAYKLHKAWRRSATLSVSLAEILSIPVQLVENQQVFSSIWYFTHLDSNFTQTLFFGK